MKPNSSSMPLGIEAMHLFVCFSFFLVIPFLLAYCSNGSMSPELEWQQTCACGLWIDLIVHCSVL